MNNVPEREWLTRLIEPALLAKLAEELPATALWSVLLDVVARRAQQRAVSSLARQWRDDRFVVPCAVDQRTLLELDCELFAAAQRFEAVELSPLAPLGSSSAVALTSQNRVVATVRGTEVVSDPTNLLALESAARLRRHPETIVRLATSHRCVRAQELPKQPGFTAHFRLFCLTTAGRQTSDRALLVDACLEHISVYLDALQRLAALGYAFDELEVRLLASPSCGDLARRIAAALPAVNIVHESLTRPYYAGLRFMINVRAPDGIDIPLIDGGAFDWLHPLAANRKLVFVASAIGPQLVAQLFRLRAR